MKFMKITSLFLLSLLCFSCGGDKVTQTNANCDAPRIINIVNFVRQTDYRIKNADSLMYATSEHQVNLLNKYSLPSTFLLQYDALINPKYQDLFKNKLTAESEIGGWWEITQPHVEAAGLKWRGEHSWVYRADIDFSIGYTPQEREKLVDVYMEKFKEIFGAYPKSVGSWFIDSHTLDYMYKKYQIVASCNCRDQMGTDGYTLWGGYWNQAYYPSRVNAYMPAQTKEGQIPVPVFRMLGSDPIYQYDIDLGTGAQKKVLTLETASHGSGDNKEWVEYFLKSIVDQPCLAFNYAQAGQENAFVWQRAQVGFEIQFPMFDSLRAANKVRIETLCESGKWFSEQFETTPATAVTTLEDFKNEGNKTVWFNSRYYRANLLWNGTKFMFRDIHLFDERYESPYYKTAGEGTKFLYFALPIVDGFSWTNDAQNRSAIRLNQIDKDGNKKEIELNEPTVTELAKDVLQVEAKDMDGNVFTIVFSEGSFDLSCSNADLAWMLELKVGEGIEVPFTDFTDKQVLGNFSGFKYGITCTTGSVKKCDQPSCVFQLHAEGGKLVVDCTNKL